MWEIRPLISNLPSVMSLSVLSLLSSQGTLDVRVFYDLPLWVVLYSSIYTSISKTSDDKERLILLHN